MGEDGESPPDPRGRVVTAAPALAVPDGLLLEEDAWDGMLATAVMDEARTYRYLLTRIWDTNRRPMVWLMLNPSTADAMEDAAGSPSSTSSPSAPPTRACCATTPIRSAPTTRSSCGRRPPAWGRSLPGGALAESSATGPAR